MGVRHATAIAMGLTVLGFACLSGPLSESALAAVAPVALPPGGAVTGLPNGGSSYPGDEGVTLFNEVIPFAFDNSALAGDLRERVIQYSQQNAYHPYGGLYFDYEIALTSGDVTGFSATGWAGFEVAVKECGISICGGSGANGVSSTGATRSSDGDIVTFSFTPGDLVGGTHSANLQFLTNAFDFADPSALLINSDGQSFSLPLVGAAVAEPSTWAMFLLGFAGVGFASRRRRGGWIAAMRS